jgi:class 3 adenylate cyclase
MPDDILTEDGFLVLADISGFTAFMTATELEHGAQITGLLLETVMGRLSPPLEIQELEGDAVFALGPDRIVPDGSRLPTVLADAFAAFTAQQRQIASEPGCECGACRQTADLSLKLIAHHGRFVRQLVGGRSRVTGSDVILAHRLLKNSVGAGAYVLLTEPALERVGLDPVAHGMRRHLVSYPYLGEVPCFVADLVSLAPPAATGAAVGAV